MVITHLPKEKMTSDFIENIHTNVFNEVVPGDFFKFDECLIAENDQSLLAYILIKEITSESVEITWGGSFKETRGLWIKKAFQEGTELLLKHYKTVTFQTRNTNIPMLKLGLSVGFKIVGCVVLNENELFVNFSKGRK
jgi:hypothetical protein